MLKYIIPAFLLLTGCFHYVWSDSHPADIVPFAPIIAHGTSGSVDWECQLEELNNTQAKFECQFKNALHFAVSPVCIKLAFSDKETKKLVIESEKVCSGVLPALETSTEYVVFDQEKRNVLRRCDDRLQSCNMFAERVF